MWRRGCPVSPFLFYSGTWWQIRLWDWGRGIPVLFIPATVLAQGTVLFSCSGLVLCSWVTRLSRVFLVLCLPFLISGGLWHLFSYPRVGNRPLYIWWSGIGPVGSSPKHKHLSSHPMPPASASFIICLTWRGCVHARAHKPWRKEAAALDLKPRPSPASLRCGTLGSSAAQVCLATPGCFPQAGSVYQTDHAKPKTWTPLLLSHSPVWKTWMSFFHYERCSYTWDTSGLLHSTGSILLGCRGGLSWVLSTFLSSLNLFNHQPLMTPSGRISGLLGTSACPQAMESMAFFPMLTVFERSWVGTGAGVDFSPLDVALKIWVWQSHACIYNDCSIFPFVDRSAKHCASCWDTEMEKVEVLWTRGVQSLLRSKPLPHPGFALLYGQSPEQQNLFAKFPIKCRKIIQIFLRWIWTNIFNSCLNFLIDKQYRFVIHSIIWNG